jgi:hypothetical protein
VNRISRDLTKALVDALRTAGAAPSYDPGRNNTHPCTFCGVKAEKPLELVQIGTYNSGEPLTRPVCPMCMPFARAMGGVPQET